MKQHSRKRIDKEFVKLCVVTTLLAAFVAVGFLDVVADGVLPLGH